MGQTRLVLASESPRRRELLARLGLSFEVDPPSIDESLRPDESPSHYVERLARDKAAQVARRHRQAVVLGADTAVVVGGRVLGKPKDAPEARQMLDALSGRTHSVLTGVCVLGRGEAWRVVETTVHFRVLSSEEVAWYGGTDEPLDKAGAYALQGRGGTFIDRIEGSPTNAIGLPMVETVALLEEAGLPMPWRAGR